MKENLSHTQTILVHPISGAEPLMCDENVKKRIRACGGSAVYGWIVRRDEYTEMRTSHVVWQAPDGKLWCVTPRFSGVTESSVIITWPETIQFIPDPEATFGDRTAARIKCVPLLPDPKLKRACEYITTADLALHDHDLERCRYWTERANREVRHLGFHWDTPTSLQLCDVVRTTLPEEAAEKALHRLSLAGWPPASQ